MLKSLAIIFLFIPAVLFAAQDNGDLTSQGEQSTSQETTSSNTGSKPKTLKAKSEEYYINSDFDRYFQADEIKQLLAGDSDFYALFRDDMTGRPRGVALLLPDWGLHAANNRGIDSLRTALPDFGWVTLSMSVPTNRYPIHILDKKDSTILTKAGNEQEATTANPAPPATAYVKRNPIRLINEDNMGQYELQIKLRLQALINEAQNYQGYFIIIAQGSSAAAVASIYADEEQDLELPEALILINAFLPDRALASKMNQDITVNSIPTLDVYPSVNRYGLTDNVKIRRKLAMKNFKTSYRQQMIFGDISFYNQNRRLLKSVYGWLVSIGL